VEVDEESKEVLLSPPENLL